MIKNYKIVQFGSLAKLVIYSKNRLFEKRILKLIRKTQFQILNLRYEFSSVLK